ncbi:DMT family transporter [Facklamia sp. DSM 111018]|uniref:DMT family transporter n=1 Tax=Facklamia lactis TaxID=2749967 RepID=A0ABS0LQI1_9LACT|nr:DMT family transporter [Facklamia lactis]MBG9986207.1 DMT family transporter [Facklamia lactis]
MTNQTKAYIAALIQVIIIGFSFLFVKIALKYVTPLALLTYRFFFATLASLFWLLLRRIKIHLNFSDFTKIAPLALFYPILFFSLQSFGLVYSSSTEAGILTATAPIFTAILAMYILKERTNLYQNVLILLSIAGVVYITVVNATGMEVFSLFGTTLLLLSTLASSFYNVLSRKLSRNYPYDTLTFVMTLIGFITFLTIQILDHTIYNTGISILEPLTNYSFLFSTLYLGVLSSFSSSLLMNFALSQIETAKFSVLMNITPIITLLAGSIFLNEIININHIVGIVTILIGVIGTNYFGKFKEEKLI